MSHGPVCTHYQFGFCKHKNFCRRRHVEEKCESLGCDTRNCEKRHPISCKYFQVYKRCKFGEFCAFDHKPSYDPLQEEIKTLKAKIDVVEKEINLKNTEILHALERIEIAMQQLKPRENQMQKGRSLNSITPSSTTTRSSTVTLSDRVIVNPISAIDQSSRIPQLDGYHHLEQLSPDTHDILCENCGKSFGRKEELELHLELHGYGCDEDECRICFTSKYLVDLHELETHPDTSYARDHIPSSTKEDFARGKRCRLDFVQLGLKLSLS